MMQSELGYISQQTPYHAVDQVSWNRARNVADLTTYDMFDDLFGGIADNSINETILDDVNCSFFGADDNNSPAFQAMQLDELLPAAPHQPTHHPANRFSDVTMTQYPTSSAYSSPVHTTQSYHVTGSTFPYSELRRLSEDFICSSDTDDSGIHSPETVTSPRDDLGRWKNDSAVNPFVNFFETPLTSCIKTTDIYSNISRSPHTEKEPQLLNMDKQESYTSKQLSTLSSGNSLFSRVPEYGACAQATKIEYNSEANNWHFSLVPKSEPSTGYFKANFTPDSPKSSTPLEQKEKPRPKRRSHGSRSRKASDKGKSIYLWEFIRDILLEPEHCPSLIKWEDRHSGVFRFVQSDTVANMWGKRKQNPKMTYEKLSRAMRYYYNHGILERVDGRRLVYKFGPKSHGWRLIKNEVKPKEFESSSLLSSSPQPYVTSSITYGNSIVTQSAATKTEQSCAFQASVDVNSVSLPSANVLLGKTSPLTSF